LASIGGVKRRRGAGAQLAGNAALTAEIVERTDGLPLFVEELTKAVLESAGQSDQVRVLAASHAAQSVSALHAHTARPTGSAAKEIVNRRSVGREFSYELIEPVAQRPERELRAALGQLSDAGLLFCRGTAPHASYLFKHALVQDAAYGTLLRARRQEMHARVAGVLERHFADLVERQPELLAHHLTAAGEIERAVGQWVKAGLHAAARLAHPEAIRHFERGLAALTALPEEPDRDGREIELQLGRGMSLFTVKGFVAPEAARAYTRAHELAERRGDQQQLFAAVYGLWQSAAGVGRTSRAADCRTGFSS
jgi:predicted ATPase